MRFFDPYLRVLKFVSAFFMLAVFTVALTLGTIHKAQNPPVSLIECDSSDAHLHESEWAHLCEICDYSPVFQTVDIFEISGAESIYLPWENFYQPVNLSSESTDANPRGPPATLRPLFSS